jgi:DDE superfamily endonuclease
MKLFEQATRAKANSKYRLLIVDGHNSHYTVAFLLLARLHMIIVICYAAHGTHIYQGLDVVVFAVLKHYLGVEWDALLCTTGKAIDKGNFLEILSKAYIIALTLELIKTAFRKTGIWPFNPNVITAEMLATSKETSVKSHLPVPTSSQPVQILATMLQGLQIAGDTPDSDADVISEGQQAGPSSMGNEPTMTTRHSTRTTRSTTHLEILEEAVAALKKTNLAFLATPTPTTAADPMPTTTTCTVQKNSLPINKATEALAIVPATVNEVHAFELQASNILNEAYAERLCAKLAAQEEKRKKKKSTKLVGDGLPRLLSGDEFYELAQEKEKEMHDIAREKERKKDGRVLYKAAVKEWEAIEQDQRDAKALAATTLKKAVKAWEKKRDSAKAKGTRFTLIKPKGGPATKAAPKPKLKDFLGAAAEDQDPKSGDDDAGEGEASTGASGSNGDDNDEND